MPATPTPCSGRTWVLLVTLLVVGCKEDGTHGPSNTLALSGSPPGFVAIDEQYEFVPTVDSAPGTTLKFAISGQPDWLQLDAATGALTGTPHAADVGLYQSIVIEVADGDEEAQLGPFDVEVVASGSRSVTIAWSAPTENEDGTVLTNLAGFEILYGRQPGRYSHRLDVPNAGVLRQVVEGLVPGSYYFAVTAKNDLDVDSDPSPEMTIIVQ